MNRRLLYIFGTLLLIALGSSIYYFTVDNERNATRRVVKYLGLSAEPVGGRFKPLAVGSPQRLGEKAWVVRTTRMPGLLDISSWLVIDREGIVFPPTDVRLSEVFRQEVHPNRNTGDQQKFWMQFVNVLSGTMSELINQPNDIPDYQMNPLPPELAQKISPPAWISEGNAVLYVYHRIGGVLDRFEFQYDAKGDFVRAVRTVFARGIGSPRAYE